MFPFSTMLAARESLTLFDAESGVPLTVSAGTKLTYAGATSQSYGEGDSEEFWSHLTTHRLEVIDGAHRGRRLTLTLSDDAGWPAALVAA